MSTRLRSLVEYGKLYLTFSHPHSNQIFRTTNSTVNNTTYYAQQAVVW